MESVSTLTEEIFLVQVYGLDLSKQLCLFMQLCGFYSIMMQTVSYLSDSPSSNLTLA